MNDEQLSVRLFQHTEYLNGAPRSMPATIHFEELSGSGILSARSLACIRMTHTKLVETSIHNTNFCDADLGSCDFSGSDLTDSRFCRANLEACHFINANMKNTDLVQAHLRNAIMFGANLTRSKLTGADLTGVDLRCANLTGANITDAKIRGADFTNAIMSGVTGIIHASISTIVGMITAILVDDKTVFYHRGYSGDAEGILACLCGGQDYLYASHIIAFLGGMIDRMREVDRP